MDAMFPASGSPSTAGRPFQRTAATEAATATSTATADSLTGSESKSTGNLSPGPDCWQPLHDFEDVSIGELAPGPRRVSFTARVVNLYDQSVSSQTQISAKGCLKILVKDDSALILVCWWWIRVSVAPADAVE
jgi:hypothetical protein